MKYESNRTTRNTSNRAPKVALEEEERRRRRKQIQRKNAIFKVS